MKVTYLELYNEEITDLLAPEGEAVQKGTEKKGLPLLEGSDGAVHVKGLEEEIVKSTDDIFRVLNRGSNRRRTAATDLNALSRYPGGFQHVVVARTVADPPDRGLPSSCVPIY